MSRVTGTVKIWKADRGFGFIRVPGEADVFVQAQGIRHLGIRDLIPGMLVEFDRVESPRYPGKFNAANVRLPDPIPAQLLQPPRPVIGDDSETESHQRLCEQTFLKSPAP
jgi:cold shock protein